MTAQEIIDALAADPTSEAALTAINELVSQNEMLTNDLAASRKAYRERFLNGEDPGNGGGSNRSGGAVTIESLFKKD